MDGILTRNWGWVALRGVAALVFGLLTLFNPGITLAVLVLFFGAYALADGVLRVISAIANRRGEPHWVAILVGGLAGIVVGVGTFLMPGVTALVLLYFIAAWAILTGAAEIATAIRLRKVMTGEWLLALAGVISVLFGVLLIARPGAGALAVVLWIGAYAIVFGIMLIALSLRLRAWGHGRGTGAMPRPA
jgi:uncharacterized membrane protein HdeD (DUF308 family)